MARRVPSLTRQDGRTIFQRVTEHFCAGKPFPSSNLSELGTILKMRAAACGESQTSFGRAADVVARVLVDADEFDHLVIQHKALLYSNSPGFRVGFGVVNSDLDFQIP